MRVVVSLSNISAVLFIVSIYSIRAARPKFSHKANIFQLQGLWASLMGLGSDVAGICKASKKFIWRFGGPNLVPNSHFA